MEYLSMPIDKELALMTHYNLTAEEWWIVKLLFLAQYPESRTQPLEEYLKITKGLNSDVLNSLQEKGVLKQTKVKKREHMDIEDLQFNIIKDENGTYPDIPFSANFIKVWLKHSNELGRELFNAYPIFIELHGQLVGARTTGNKFGTMDDLFFFYGKTIKWDPEVHKQIIQIIEQAKEQNLIRIGLARFVIEQRWIELQTAFELGEGSYNPNVII